MNFQQDFQDNRRVGYAYVVPQRLGKVYTPRKALAEGTIFPELNITASEYTRGIRHGT
ncbi:MAG: spore coat associated protein CotJA [Oscillospiraceae bacterium]|nr:spore coat associated protein CotJA [Oscillospiraceae bacterium]